MSMMNLAWRNFKSSFKNYLAVILSLSFTILVIFNFQNLLDSDMFALLGKQNGERIDMLVQTVSFVLGCFMFFFLWYATNVFLTTRKKEIGIYVFMGLTNQKIAWLYTIEVTMIGLSSLVLGIVFGILTAQLFQMILLAISDLSVSFSFHFALRPVYRTAGGYLVMYLIFVCKGYVNLVRSSVLDMISAIRQKEYVKQNVWLLFVKSVAGVSILFFGYYMAVKEGGQEVMGNVLAAVALVVIGVYLLFGGFLPMCFLGLAKKKTFLYRKQRTLWINQVIFRMKRNYRTYAMTCILMLCSVTALATGFAMRSRYDAIVHFRNTYTYQFLCGQKGLDAKVRPLIEQDNQIAYSAQIPILLLDADLVKTRFAENGYALLSYSKLRDLAKASGLEFTLTEPNDREVVKVSKLHMLSLLTDRSHETVTINGTVYDQVVETTVPYLGYFQELMSFYLVNDDEYQRLLPLGEEQWSYHYQIRDINNFAASKEALDTLQDDMAGEKIARVTIDPNSSDIEWIKMMYTICIFLFMVFVLASGSILFMKLYHDAFEEQERCQTLIKLGVAKRTLKKSFSHELQIAYGLPFAVMAVSAYFSVHALEKMMYTNLILIYLRSVGVVFLLLCFFYVLSTRIYARNAGIK